MSKNIIFCPFCKGHAAVKARRLNQPHMRGVIQIFVECKTCHARGPSFMDFHNDDSVSTMSDKAINAWNNRVTDTTLHMRPPQKMFRAFG